ncbi:MAG: amidase [Armatimonadota bacterium]|nr:amidase [Armatimonadota bacterium]MDW8156213.1 amidase [Armatimonadota bacterium]
MAELWELTAREAAELVATRQVSARELVRAALDRAEQLEPSVHAWARLDPERALEEAGRLDERLRRGERVGPLHGVPVGVKDIIYTRGLETSAGSPLLRGFVPAEDATVVARLREAGAIVLGKTVTTQFAFLDPGPTRNPWNLDHTPGGSSSGSAAAVACGMVPAALGTQTVGSILRPAAYCGIVGLKPTYGRVSRHGILPLSWTLDHPGFLVRTVEDAALLLEVLAGPDGLDPACAPHPVERWTQACRIGPSGLRVGVPDRFFSDRAIPEVREAYGRALASLEGAGVQVREVKLPREFEAGLVAQRTILASEAATFHRRWFDHRRDDYGPKLRALLEEGGRIPATEYIRARQIRRACRRGMAALFGEVDVLATPATPAPAPRGLESTGDPSFNGPFSFVGFPSVTVPVGLSQEGLPLGVQLAAAPFAEATLLRAAAALEGVCSWGRRLAQPLPTTAPR